MTAFVPLEIPLLLPPPSARDGAIVVRAKPVVTATTTFEVKTVLCTTPFVVQEEVYVDFTVLVVTSGDLTTVL